MIQTVALDGSVIINPRPRIAKTFTQLSQWPSLKLLGVLTANRTGHLRRPENLSVPRVLAALGT